MCTRYITDAVDFDKIKKNLKSKKVKDTGRNVQINTKINTFAPSLHLTKQISI